MIVSKVKKYKTRAGREVVIYAIYPEQKYAVHGAQKLGKDWITENWNMEGEFLAEDISGEDLIEVSPYSDIPIDAKVIVWHNNAGPRHRRYFAGANELGEPTTWFNGATSWSNKEAPPTVWGFCVLESDYTN